MEYVRVTDCWAIFVNVTSRYTLMHCTTIIVVCEPASLAKSMGWLPEHR